jgi:hypothetical protein
VRDEIDAVGRGLLDLKGIHYPIATYEAVERPVRHPTGTSRLHQSTSSLVL